MAAMAAPPKVPPALPTPVPPSAPLPTPNVVIPPLEPGDHLTPDEFERRYDVMPGLKKAELIEGVVHMPSPVRQDYHGEPHMDVVTWLGTYKVHTPHVSG